MKASSTTYRPKDWVGAFLVVALCYAAGEFCVWAFGLKLIETPVWYRVVERTCYGMIPLVTIGIIVVKLASGKWLWQLKGFRP
ncbi:hypothetical protein D9M73_51850 [compost metagenome]